MTTRELNDFLTRTGPGAGTPSRRPGTDPFRPGGATKGPPGVARGERHRAVGGAERGRGAERGLSRPGSGGST